MKQYTFQKCIWFYFLNAYKVDDTFYFNIRILLILNDKFHLVKMGQEDISF